MYADKNSCGFSDSIPAGISITAVTTTIIKSVCTYTVLTTDFTKKNCEKTEISHLMREQFVLTFFVENEKSISAERL
jgi:hypothetical protein